MRYLLFLLILATACCTAPVEPVHPSGDLVTVVQRSMNAWLMVRDEPPAGYSLSQTEADLIQFFDEMGDPMWDLRIPIRAIKRSEHYLGQDLTNLLKAALDEHRSDSYWPSGTQPEWRRVKMLEPRSLPGFERSLRRAA